MITADEAKQRTTESTLRKNETPGLLAPTRASKPVSEINERREKMNDLELEIDEMGITQQGANMRACLQTVQPEHAFMIGEENRTGAPAKNLKKLNTKEKKQIKVKGNPYSSDTRQNKEHCG